MIGIYVCVPGDLTVWNTIPFVHLKHQCIEEEGFPFHIHVKLYNG